MFIMTNINFFNNYAGIMLFEVTAILLSDTKVGKNVT